jgi:protein gp37
MGKTSIEWTDFSTNPIRARDKTTGAVGHHCEKISSGCAHCYAANLQKRFNMPAFGGVKSELPENIEIFLDHSVLEKVVKRRKSTKYFWCDMTDMFGWWVTDEMLDWCFAAMALTGQHTHQVLTKRPERALEYLQSRSKSIKYWQGKARELGYSLQYEGIGMVGFPLPNVWLGVSVENQEQADARIPHLLKTPAAVRFLSCEPLLGPLDLSKYLTCAYCEGPEADYHTACLTTVNWVIIGGESGRGARLLSTKWVRDIRDQCKAAGVARFIKQLGKDYYEDDKSGARRRYSSVDPKDTKGGNWDHWPEDLRIREFPESAARLTGG